MKTINSALKNHYRNKSLSETQVSTLMELQQQQEQSDDTFSQRSRPKRFSFLAMAASVMVTVIAVWVFNINHNDVREKVAQEIAYNHSKRMQLEITSDDLNTVRTRLSELDFALIDSDKEQQPQWELLGGRYCSIQGKLAAQLRVKQNNSTDYHTYYQAIIPDGLNLRGHTYSTWIDGIHVKLWVEGGILLGLAGESSESKE